MRTRRIRTPDERGVAGGGEALAFGAVVLLAGTLLITNVWSIIETRTAVDVAAREYLRTYTHRMDHERAALDAEGAARQALRSRGTPLTDLQITAPRAADFGPCGRASVVLIATVPTARVPFLGELASTEVRVSHSELIDAHREVDAHEAFDASATACAGP